MDSSEIEDNEDDEEGQLVLPLDVVRRTDELQPNEFY